VRETEKQIERHQRFAERDKEHREAVKGRKEEGSEKCDPDKV